MKNSCSVTLMAVCLIAGALANPVRRSPDLEARRRSAIDRSMIRFGRSYPAEPSAAEIRELFQRQSRRGNSFLRFGRSQPMSLTTDDLIALLKAYEDDYEASAAKRASTAFVRFGRDPKFIRLGRSESENGNEETSELVVSGYPQRKNRARDHFIRLGRDSEELNDVEETTDDRNERSVETVESVDSGCHNCLT